MLSMRWSMLNLHIFFFDISCCLGSGPVTNAFIVLAPANMFLPDSRPTVPLPRFSRHLQGSEGDGGESGAVWVRLGLYAQVRSKTLRFNDFNFSQVVLIESISLLLRRKRRHTCRKLIDLTLWWMLWQTRWGKVLNLRLLLDKYQLLS